MTLKLEKDKTIIAQKWPDAISTSTPVTRIALLTLLRVTTKHWVTHLVAQTIILSLKQPFCRSNNHLVDQTTILSLKQPSCRSNNSHLSSQL